MSCRRERGIGTQVVRAKVKRLVELSSLWDDLVSSDQKPTTTVLSNMTEPAIVLQAAAQTIGARAATQAEARMLEEAKGAPLLTMERVTYDETGQAIEYASHIYRASRYSFELSLVAR